MVLTYLGIEIGYPQLAKRLRAGSSFTPFGHLRYLESLDLHVTMGEQGDLGLFESNLELGLPIIVGVQTLTWEHWQGEVTRHAVVVVGIDQAANLVYVHDPFFATAPIEMPLLNFQIGWEEKDREYAIIGLAPP
ncbi:MAG: C39 family peptidase [Caldilineaceae bacterium]